jgi:hypothetical protein
MRTLHVSVREARMSVERTLLTCGVPGGAVHGVRECVLLSEALGLGGFEYLLRHHVTLQWRLFRDVSFQDATLDGGGIHAWLVLPTLVDLAVAEARRGGRAVVTAANVAEPGELKIAEAMARRYGAVAEVSGGRLCVHNASRPVTMEQWDPLLLAAFRHGFDVEEDTWRALHSLSNRALAPDSVQSRRHAGPVVVNDDGSIQGRLPQDDDFDMSMLKKVAP